MTSNIFVKDLYHLIDFTYSLKVNCNAKHEFYTCSIEWKRHVPKDAHPIISIPMEFMKDLINYMNIMYEILEKNKGLIIDQKLGIGDHMKTFSVLSYMAFEMQLFLSINVAPIGQSLTVGLHYRDVKGKVGNIFLSFDQLI